MFCRVNPRSLENLKENMKASLKTICTKPQKTPGPMFTKETDVLPQDLAKSRCREISI